MKEESCAHSLCALACHEDAVASDVTSRCMPDIHATCHIAVRARTNAVIAGMPLLHLLYTIPGCTIEYTCDDSTPAEKDDILAYIHGPVYDILSRERIALNFLQRLSGIATLTARYVAAVKDTEASIVDTRKTLPGWRALDKYAVRCGGGVNHRYALDDMIMIKDNHWSHAGNTVAEYITHARKKYPELPIACEADTVDAAKSLIPLDIDILMCDNMTLTELRDIVEYAQKRVTIEATGGVTLDTVGGIARTGVDRISIGALTHSAPAIDIAFDTIHDR